MGTRIGALQFSLSTISTQLLTKAAASELRSVSESRFGENPELVKLDMRENHVFAFTKPVERNSGSITWAACYVKLTCLVAALLHLIKHQSAACSLSLLLLAGFEFNTISGIVKGLPDSSETSCFSLVVAWLRFTSVIPPDKWRLPVGWLCIWLCMNYLVFCSNDSAFYCSRDLHCHSNSGTATWGCLIGEWEADFRNYVLRYFNKCCIF